MVKTTNTDALDFVVIGTMKGGTTSLYNYLTAHPAIDLCRVKELNFFNNDDHWSRGRKWYESHFACDGRIRGDVNPNYAMYPTCTVVPERLREFAPSVRLIYLLRDPVKRMESHIQHYVAEGRERRDMDSIVVGLEAGDDVYGYLSYSRYGMQIGRLLEHFPRESLLALRSEDLRSDRPGTLDRIFEFVGVDGSLADSGVLSREYHETGRKRIYPAAIRLLFQNPAIGGAVHKTVLGAKRMLPMGLYEAGRRAISSQPRRIAFDEIQRERCRLLLEEDQRLLRNQLAAG